MDTYTQDIHDVSEALGKEYMEAMFTCVNRFYVDLEYLIDFRLTALLCLMTPSDYDIVCTNIENYNNRTSLSTVASFPGVSVSDEQITEFLKNPANLELYATRLQYTNYFSVLLDTLRSQNVKNKLSGHKESRIHLWIGNSGFPLNKLHADYLLDTVVGYVPGVKVTITNTGLLGYSQTLLQSIQNFSLYNVEAVFNHPNFNANITSGLFAGRVINACPFITRDTEGLPDDELIRSSEELLNLFFDFNYIRAKVHHEK
jgi:hypothetical protein